MNELAQGRAQLRSYRNRRVGEFLKELDLTEGRGTGIPRIIEELRKNGSPPPKFHTNDERTFFVTEIPIHPSFLTEQEPVGAHDRAHDGAHDGAHDVRGLDEALNPTEERILQFCSASAKNLAEIMAHLSLATRTGFLTRTLERLTEAGLLAMTIPDKPRSKNQKRITTPKGLAALKNTPGRVQDDKT
jgi:ATP-dependent DNA helicase RecG